VHRGANDVTCIRWLREAVSDENGQADIAYISLFALMIAVGMVVLFICVMVGISYFRCTEKCAFDPLPLGQAVGLISAAFFGTGLTGLAAYMLATRKPKDAPPVAPIVTTATTTTVQAPSIIDAAATAASSSVKPKKGKA